MLRSACTAAAASGSPLRHPCDSMFGEAPAWSSSSAHRTSPCTEAKYSGVAPLYRVFGSAPSFKVFLSFPTRPSAAASHSHLGSFFFVLSFTSWLGAAVYRLDERNVQ